MPVFVTVVGVVRNICVDQCAVWSSCQSGWGCCFHIGFRQGVIVSGALRVEQTKGRLYSVKCENSSSEPGLM